MTKNKRLNPLDKKFKIANTGMIKERHEILLSVRNMI